MKKIVTSLTIILMLVCFFCSSRTWAQTEVKITTNGQVVDTFMGVDAIYATLSSYSNVDNNTTYSCAAFLKKFCSKVWGVNIFNINTVNGPPSVSKTGHTVSLKTVSSPKPGDIMQTKTYSHVAIVKYVSGSNAILIEQNCSKNNNGYRYAYKDRSVAISSVYFYRIVIDGKEVSLAQNPPDTPTITSVDGSGSNVTVKWNGVSGAEKYVVDFWSTTGSHNYYSTTETSMTKSLTDGQYGVRVCAENSAGQSAYTGFHYIWVSKSTVPAVPVMPNVVVNGSEVTVSWEPVDKAYKYTVDFWEPEGSHNYFSTTGITMTKTLTDGQYGIRVFAENTAGQSGFTSFAYIRVGTIPIAFDANGEDLEKTKARINYDSINGARGENQLVIYDNSGSSTGTNQYGIEVLIQDNKVIDIVERVGSATVPDRGFVLSGHGEKGSWLYDNVKKGDYVNIHPNVQSVWIWTENGWLTWTKKVQQGRSYGKLPLPISTSEHEFLGWFTEANGGEKIESDSIVTKTEEHTLYAHWGKTTLLVGDMDGDGALTAKDVTLLRRAIATGSASENPTADFDGDGSANAKDVTKLRRAITSGAA